MKNKLNQRYPVKFNKVDFEVAYLFEYQKWIHIFCNKNAIKLKDACTLCLKKIEDFNSEKVVFFERKSSYGRQQAYSKWNDFKTTQTPLNLNNYSNRSVSHSDKNNHFFCLFVSTPIYNLDNSSDFLRVFQNEIELSVNFYRNEPTEYFNLSNNHQNFIINKKNLIFYKYELNKNVEYIYSKKKWKKQKHVSIKKLNLVVFFEMLTNNIFNINKNAFLFNEDTSKKYISFLKDTKNAFLELIDYKEENNNLINTEIINYHIYKKIIKIKKNFDLDFNNYRNLFYLLTHFRISTIMSAWDNQLIKNFGLYKLWIIIFFGKKNYKKMTKAEWREIDKIVLKYYTENNCFSYKFFLKLTIFASFSGDINKINKKINDLETLKVNFSKNKHIMFFDSDSISYYDINLINWFFKYIFKLTKKEKETFYRFIFKWLKNKNNNSRDLLALLKSLKSSKNLKIHKIEDCQTCNNKNNDLSNFINHLNNYHLDKIKYNPVKIKSPNYNFNLITTYKEFEHTSISLKNCLRRNYLSFFGWPEEHLFFTINDCKNKLIGAVYIWKHHKTKKWKLQEASGKSNIKLPNDCIFDIKSHFIETINTDEYRKNMLIQNKHENN